MNGSTALTFNWDSAKAGLNERKHGISFKLATTIFADPAIQTFADFQHSGLEERWYAIGRCDTGAVLLVVHTFSGTGSIGASVSSPPGRPQRGKFKSTKDVIHERYK